MTTTVSRRDFLKTSGLVGVIGASQTMFPSWMPKMAFRPNFEGGPGDVLVCVFLRGGIDGLSAVVPYGEGANYYDVRPTIAVPAPGNAAGAAIDLDGFFGLHPSLSGLKEVWDEGDLGIVHATGLTDASRSHFDAMRIMEYGTPGNKLTGTGWIGRHLESAAWENNSPFRAVGMGTLLPESLRGPVTPLAIKSIADFHFRGREDEAARLRRSLSSLYTLNGSQATMGNQASLVFETVDMLKSISAERYLPTGGATYSDDEFGNGLRQVSQLIKADVGLEVACLDLGGWDTHEYQGTLDGGYAQQLGGLGNALAAMYADLGDRMNRVTVVVMSEFGRRVAENGSYGTDHGHGNVMFLMGGGVRGQLYTRWPTLARAALADGDLAITTDYRDVLAEIISQRMLNPALDKVFPNFTPTALGLVDKA